MPKASIVKVIFIRSIHVYGSDKWIIYNISTQSLNPIKRLVIQKDTTEII